MGMSCTFSIPTTSSLAEINIQASTALLTAGGTFIPTDTGGVFSISTYLGLIAGNYNVISESVNVIITDKPWFLPCGTIESKLTEYIIGNT